jgi:hypothetical protein
VDRTGHGLAPSMPFEQARDRACVDLLSHVCAHGKFTQGLSGFELKGGKLI